jgi:hypothetical protein
MAQKRPNLQLFTCPCTSERDEFNFVEADTKLRVSGHPPKVCSFLRECLLFYLSGMTSLQIFMTEITELICKYLLQILVLNTEISIENSIISILFSFSASAG